MKVEHSWGSDRNSEVLVQLALIIEFDAAVEKCGVTAAAFHLKY